jgi:LysM repeat protein
VNKKFLIIISVVLAVSAVFLAAYIHKAGRTANADADKRSTVSLANLASQAKEMENTGKLPEAREIYKKLVDDFPGSPDVGNWQKKTEDINIRLLFSPTITEHSRVYEIKPGDTLNKIARAFKTTTELIMKSNNIADSRIIPGRKIKVWDEPFKIFVDKSQNILLLKCDEEVVKTYTVSTGKNNCTPVGTFKITSKLPDPTWFKAGAAVPPGSPDNVLGTRWMGFDLPGYGIHGTTEPKELGKQVTQGCVRLANSDVEELYSIVPLGTEVTIVD